MGGCHSNLGCCHNDEGVADFTSPVIDTMNVIEQEPLSESPSRPSCVKGAASYNFNKVVPLDAEFQPLTERISAEELLLLDVPHVEPPLPGLDLFDREVIVVDPPIKKVENQDLPAAFQKIGPSLDVKGQLAGELVDGIIWAPGGVYKSECSVKYNVIQALDLCCDANYRVTHYTKDAQGRAFGPLSLEQVLSFCSRLKERTQQGQRVVLTTPPNDEPSRTNASVLLGSFLIHVQGWTLTEVTKAMSADAERKFVCSWARRDRPEPARRMRVHDCWAAIEEAGKQGWLPQKGCVDPPSEPLLETWKMRATYDAAWIVPGKILLCADPVSTAVDPNPATFATIFPSSETANSERSAEFSKRGEFCHDDAEVESVTSFDSVNTVNKDYDEDDIASNETMDDHEHMPFTDFLHRCGVRLLVRANYPNEPGLPGSYDSKRFASFDIEHLDVPFADVNGGLPSAAIIDKVLQTCKAILKENSDAAVAIHCKGGFGRSAVLAACVASSCFQIPGPALLAWVRIARPGAVTTPQQEHFIQHLGKEHFDGANLLHGVTRKPSKSYTSIVKATRNLKEDLARRMPTGILASKKSK
jgi:hypothetical protein